jgi:tol-pal system beta propeller repeat protein TolB
MKKNKLYVFIAILTSIFLLSTAAIANKCVVKPEEEAAGEEAEEEIEEEIPEEAIEKETTEEEIVYEIAFGSEGTIFSCKPDGSDIKMLYDAGFYIGDPCWNADHTKIVFRLTVSFGDWGDDEIFMYDLITRDVIRLIERDGEDMQPSFSPDGEMVVFTSSIYEGNGDFNYEIFRVNIDGSNLTQLTDSPEMDMEPCFSPDGKTIVFTRYMDSGAELYIMDVDGGNIKRLTDNDASDVYANFSPDGEYIAFASDRGGDCDIWVMAADGSGEPKNLTNNPGRDLLPDYSPDGTMIVFESNRDEDEEYAFDIFTMTSEGENQNNIADGIDPSW